MKTVGAYQAKTHLPQLLEQVVNQGETITITKHGVPVAQLIPIPGAQGADVGAAIQELRALRQEISLAGLSVPELVAEGRRF